MSSSAPLLILISAPSGGGKTTLCDLLLEKHPDITRAVTCTTRSPRDGEQDGVHYHFLDSATFDSKVAAGEFLEHARVYDRQYGVLKSEVLNKLRSGRSVLLNIDVQGAATIRTTAQSDPLLRDSLINVFLTPESMDVLEQRLSKRGSESEETLARRLKEARAELSQWDRFDYLIISTTKEEDLRRMETIIEAERMRQSRSLAPRF